VQTPTRPPTRYEFVLQRLAEHLERACTLSRLAEGNPDAAKLRQIELELDCMRAPIMALDAVGDYARACGAHQEANAILDAITAAALDLRALRHLVHMEYLPIATDVSKGAP
jgi:hypothetical protein